MALYENDAQMRRNTEMAELIDLNRFGGPSPIRLDKPVAGSAAKVSIGIGNSSTP